MCTIYARACVQRVWMCEGVIDSKQPTLDDKEANTGPESITSHYDRPSPILRLHRPEFHFSLQINRVRDGWMRVSVKVSKEQRGHSGLQGFTIRSMVASHLSYGKLFTCINVPRVPPRPLLYLLRYLSRYLGSSVLLRALRHVWVNAVESAPPPHTHTLLGTLLVSARSLTTY